MFCRVGPEVTEWDVPYKKVLKSIWSKSELKGTYNRRWGLPGELPGYKRKKLDAE